jgi:hypothetical protein
MCLLRGVAIFPSSYLFLTFYPLDDGFDVAATVITVINLGVFLTHVDLFPVGGYRVECVLWLLILIVVS